MWAIVASEPMPDAREGRNITCSAEQVVAQVSVPGELKELLALRVQAEPENKDRPQT